MKHFYVEQSYYSRERDTLVLKVAKIEKATEELKEAKKNMEEFIARSNDSFNKIITAGTLLGVLLKNKRNEIVTKIDEVQP